MLVIIFIFIQSVIWVAVYNTIMEEKKKERGKEERSPKQVEKGE